MNREYHRWYSPRLGKDMQLLVFGHAGTPLLVFPTSQGRFFDYEDRGMIAAVSWRYDSGAVQAYCVDSVDAESWYNRRVAPRWRIVRHQQYEDYLLNEIVPFARGRNSDPRLIALGCSFGGYHAVNIALRHPDIFTGFLSLSGAFDLTGFLDGYYDQDCYYHLPTHNLPGLTDPWFLSRYRRSTYVLATGWDDQCLQQNRDLDRVMTEKAIPHQFYVWNERNSHDWPTWQRMAQMYL